MECQKDKKKEKMSIISSSNAIIDPRAMMIEFLSNLEKNYYSDKTLMRK